MSVEHLIDIDRETGEYLQGWPRIRQSIVTILTTRLRTRLMRLWWGSEFLDMQDKPANEQTFMDGIFAAIEAINTYEPEFRVTKVTIEDLGPLGSVTITVEGVDLVEQTARRVSTTL
ncbi:MAG: GPW/gp25 family protein [Aeromicrobium sp.]